jgi:hypothetical protein
VHHAGAGIRSIIAQKGFSVDLVSHIAEHYNLSIMAAAIQLASCAPINWYIVLCAYARIPRWSSPRTELSVEYAGTSARNKYPLARFTPVPTDHVLYSAWRDGVAVDGPSYMPYKSGG